jgi:hypothetical protein
MVVGRSRSRRSVTEAVGRQSVAEARWCQSPRFSASLIDLRVRVCGGAVGMVNVDSRAPTCLTFYMTLREGGPTATNNRRPDQGASQIGKPIRRSLRGDHYSSTPINTGSLTISKLFHARNWIGQSPTNTFHTLNSLFHAAVAMRRSLFHFLHGRVPATVAHGARRGGHGSFRFRLSRHATSRSLSAGARPTPQAHRDHLHHMVPPPVLRTRTSFLSSSRPLLRSPFFSISGKAPPPCPLRGGSCDGSVGV